jgi:PiT family inorganic phosphate transporter
MTDRFSMPTVTGRGINNAKSVASPMASLVVLAVTAAVILLALVFAFTNGYNDASASVATMIACGAATPRNALIFASIVGFFGAVLGGSAIILTIESLIMGASGLTLVYILFSTVVTAVMWNLLSSRVGLPTSSTHAMMGGLIGAGVAANGLGGVLWGVDELFGPDPQLVGVTKVFVFLIASVGLGLIGGYVAMKISHILLRNATKSANLPIRRVQWLTSGLLAFSHGANDAQKQMAIIALALMGASLASTDTVPVWARIAVALMMAVGTLGGGWKIMKTLGREIYVIRPIHSLSSQVPSSISIIWSTLAGAPVSATQVVASSVIGVGTAENSRMVQWRVGRSMVISWFVTIPVCSVASGAIFLVLNAILQGA